MTFSELLNEYMKKLECTAKEISAKSGLTPSVISRYRSGERVPPADGDSVIAIASAIEIISKQKNIDLGLSKNNIITEINSSIDYKGQISRRFSSNFNNLLGVLEIKINRLAKYINYDASFISRVRQGKRYPSDIPDFSLSVAEFVSKYYTSNADIQIISKLIGCDYSRLNDINVRILKIHNWLCSEKVTQNNNIGQFLKKLDDFDLNDYIRVIKFDELKVPSVPFIIKNSKNYYGIKEMMCGELDFIKSTVLSKSQEPVIMYSDMPMTEMSKYEDFPKKWMFGMALMLKKGLRFEMIHNVDRPFNEMMLGLESWIPMYMTGQVSPYYLKGANECPFNHFLKVSGAVAISGEAISNFQNDGKYYLTKNSDEVKYYRKNAENLLKKSLPLMDIFREESKEGYRAFNLRDMRNPHNRRSVLSSLPLYTASLEFIKRIIVNKAVPKETAEKILGFYNEQHDYISEVLKNCTVNDEIPELTREEFEKHSLTMSLAGAFLENDIPYTYEEYLEHLMLSKKFAEENENYSYTVNQGQPFRNIQIVICKDNWVMISKNKSPAIHFLIHHPKMCSAIEDMKIPIIE